MFVYFETPKGTVLQLSILLNPSLSWRGFVIRANTKAHSSEVSTDCNRPKGARRRQIRASEGEG
jgi:hypothetical protein